LGGRERVVLEGCMGTYQEKKRPSQAIGMKAGNRKGPHQIGLFVRGEGSPGEGSPRCRKKETEKRGYSQKRRTFRTGSQRRV